MISDKVLVTITNYINVIVFVSFHDINLYVQYIFTHKYDRR